jgi:LAGLIDADG DNA endonuclease family
MFHLISTILLLCAVLFSFHMGYTQDMGFLSGLLISSLLPVKPRLTKVEKEAFSLSQELKDITIGLLLGDLYVRKQKLGVNASLSFRQGIVHEDYLNHLFKKFQDFC